MAQGTDFILRALVAEGLDHLFMVPGGLIDPFLPALGRVAGLAPIVAAHEGGAAYMADGYARASGRFGAVLGIGGPGLTNMATAVAAAKTDSSPVLVLSGEVARAMEGLGAFQDASQATLDDTAVMKPLTRLSATVADVENLNHWLRHALTTMLSRPRGPVHLSLTHDALVGEAAASYVPVSPFFAAVEPLSLPQAEAALATLAATQDGRAPRIVCLAGAGVRDPVSAARLKEVAERLAMPVATTLRAKDAFPEDHDLSLGVFGYAGTRHATAAVFADDLDLLLVLGSGLNERDTMHWTLRERAKAVTIHVNTDMDELTAHCEATHAVPGSAGAFLELMAQRLGGGPTDAALAERRAFVARIKAGPRLYDIESCARPGRPIHPAAAVTALRQAFPRDGIVLVDSGAHRAFMGHYWEAYEPGTYVSATNLGPMGWAIPAAVGVQCARPDRRVAVVTGDGCMHMHGIEIQTAARHRLPIVYVVLNNAALGNVWLRAHTEGAVPAALTSLPDHDWAGFSRALGGEGFTVTDPAALEETFAKALACGTTAMVDVKADKDCPTPVYDFSAGAKAWSYHE
ncbi:thiamine pyrophosphate-binding protein [Rhodoplanes sp. TEM]|uniref:Thiamine pyrophosphate-binding protein n=1 Tax=Rhodoplanes tepidamans TaxID=200616 RepID=A0ABT5JIB9_RHOTP|nr:MULTISPECIES: thiamine pyrophosphate-binding protein [Rhodoplanes]MDC7789341.1 thiamine pyrophosphate-binding protein [Rhodoplanes tepidamans]MDC7986030.1 thiamine pyrophosphate-binding protein [Rhodoplanes sp. TEM]MDQ0358980.1 acetolactate synthase-1/2/3 large subunit [Rhodoplanes tepidamans]